MMKYIPNAEREHVLSFIQARAQLAADGDITVTQLGLDVTAVMVEPKPKCCHSSVRLEVTDGVLLRVVCSCGKVFQ